MNAMVTMSMKEPSTSQPDALLAAPPNRSYSLASDSTSEVQANGAIRTTANDIALPRVGHPSSTGQHVTRANATATLRIGVAAARVTPWRYTAGIATIPAFVPTAILRHVLRPTERCHERGDNTKECEEAPPANTPPPRGDALMRHTMSDAAGVPRPRR